MDRDLLPSSLFPTTFFLLEEEQDRRAFRIATVVAVLVHVALFGITFPELTRDVAEARERRVFVVHPVQRRPPVDPRDTLPRQRARRIPIPDPTPADPEPLLRAVSEPLALDIPSELAGLDHLVPPPPPRPAPTGAIEFHSGLTRPVRVAGADPQYTEIARRARLEGVVILRAIITRRGEVRDIEIVKPLGLGLEHSAVEAVTGWRFEPATLDGEPVDVVYRVTVRFALR